MREIKFRGRAISDSCGEPVNKMVFGDITQGWDKVTIFDWSDGDFYEVEPETVAQFVGYDKNGKEIYSDDKIRIYDSFGDCEGTIDADDFFKFYEIGKTFKSVELVEEK